VSARMKQAVLLIAFDEA